MNGSGSGGLNFVVTCDISEVEKKAKQIIDTFAKLQNQTNALSSKAAVDEAYRKEQVAIQKALADSRLALQKLKEEQAAQRVELEKSRAVAAEHRAEAERLKRSEQALNLEYKEGKVALQQYMLEQRKIADAQREATRQQREAERTLKEQVRLQKEQEKQAERNRRQLEKESSEYYKLTQALGKVRKEAKDVQAEMFRLEREGLKASDAYRQLEIRSKALTTQTQVLDQGVKRIDASLGLHQRNVGNYGSALAGISPIFAAIEQQLGNFGTSLDDIATRPDPFKALGTSLMAFGRATLAFLATPVGAILALLGGLYALISSNKQTVIEFDAALKGVGKTTGLADEELERLGDSVIKLSNNLKSVSSKQLLDYAQAAGQLGVKGSQNILRFAETMAMLDTASDVDSEGGPAAIARLLELTDHGVENVQAFGDEIVNLGNNMAATENEILGNATRIAQATTLYKVGRQDVLAYAAATKAVGLQAEVVGSSFSRTFGSIEAAIRTGKNIETFASVTGRSVEDLKASFKDDASGIFKDFVKGLNGVAESGGSVQGVLQSLNITSVEDQRVIASLATNYGVLTDALKLAGDASGSMQKEFDTANKKLENVGKRIGIAWDNLVLSIENGQGVFARVGSYIGNEFADLLVSTKGVIDELGIAFKVAGQFLADYTPKAQEAGEMNMQYADVLKTILDFLSDISLRSFIFTFTVQIPNAIRTGGAHIEAFVNKVTGFVKFISTASKDIGNYFMSALNPFERGVSASNISELYKAYERQTRESNRVILDAAREENEKYIQLFRDRYDAATAAVEEGEQAVVDAATKGLNGALAAANEAELAAAEAMSAASKNKFKDAEAAAKRAEEAAKRAAAEAAVASEEAKTEANAAAQKAADAATKARQAADTAMENVKARRALQEKIDALNQEANRKQLDQNEAEIQAVRDKYAKMREEVEAFYKDPKNAGLKVDTSGLKASEQKEVEDVAARQQVDALKASLAERKQLYAEYQQYVSEFGEAKARERFKDEIGEFESYVAYLKSLVPDASDKSVLATRMLEALTPAIQKAEKEARDKEFDEQVKNLQRILEATRTAKQQELLIEEQYQKDLAQLRKHYANDPEALAAATARVTEEKNLRIQAAYDEEIKRTNIYKKATADITNFTRKQVKAQITAIDEVLKTEKLSEKEREELLRRRKQLQEDLAMETAESIANMSNGLREAASLIGKFDAAAAKTVNTVADLAGSVANIAAGFASGDPMSMISGAIGAVGALFSLFDRSAEREAAAAERRQWALERTQEAIEEMNRALARQAEIIEKALGTDRIDAYRRQMQLLATDISSTIQKLEALNLATRRERGGPLDYSIDLTSYESLLGQVEGRQRDRNGGPSKDINPSDEELLKALEDALKDNRQNIEKIYQDLASGKLVGDTDQLRTLLEQYEQLENQLESLKQELQEEVTGISFSSLIDEITSMFAEGKVAAEDFAKFFEEKMEAAVIRSFQRKAIEKQMQEFYEEFATAAGDGLTEEEIEELRKTYLEKMDAARAELENLNKIAGTDVGAIVEEQSQDTLTGAIRGQLTEETGGKLAGIYQGIFGLNKQQLAVQEQLLKMQEGSYLSMGEMLDIGKQQLYYQQQIASNTLKNAESSIRIESKLERIITNTNPGQSSRDMGLGG